MAGTVSRRGWHRNVLCNICGTKSLHGNCPSSFLYHLGKHRRKPVCNYFLGFLIKPKNLLASEISSHQFRWKTENVCHPGELGFLLEISGGWNQVKSCTRGKGIAGRNTITIPNVLFLPAYCLGETGKSGKGWGVKGLTKPEKLSEGNSAS